MKRFMVLTHKRMQPLKSKNGVSAPRIKKRETVFRYAELFSGPGGLALGAKMARVETEKEVFVIKHAWACDYDKDSCQTYRHNICPEKPESVICQDVRKLDITQLSQIDAFAFGFPCNDFSVVGEQKGINGKFGSLYRFGVEILQHFKPRFFVAENVSGLISSNEGKVFEKILDELHSSGYTLYPHIYFFEQFGVPQTRRRIIIVGIRKDIKATFRVPAVNSPLRSCRDAIENPPISPNTANQELTAQSKTVIERLKHIKPGENAFTASLPEYLLLNVRGAKISQIYRRLNPEKPAYTITGSGGGGTHVYHWSQDRALTNRERARLQAFPDDFVFYGPKESVRKQIGMAVPPLAAKILFEAILKTFAGINYPHQQPNISLDAILNGKKQLALA